jgi:cell division protein FtsX
MKELERKTEALINGEWLNGDIGAVVERAAKIGRRRRRTAAVAVAAFVLVFASVALARTRSTNDASVLTAAQIQALDCATVIKTGINAHSVLVFMKATASQPEIDATRRSIEAIPGSRDVRLHGKSENLEQFRELFKDSPDLATGVSEDNMAVSFTASIDTAQPAEFDRSLDALRNLSGVSVTTGGDEPCQLSDPEMHELLDGFVRGQSRWRDGTDAIVFLDPHSSPSQRDDVARTLVENPTVRRVVSFTQQDSYDEFKCLFPDDQAMLDTITPEILPWSYRLELDDGQEAAVVRDQVSNMPGVKTVVMPPSLDDVITTGTITPSLYQQLTNGPANANDSPENCGPAGQQIK